MGTIHPSPAEVYRARRADRAGMVSALADRHDRLASGRLAVAALAVAIGWGAFGQDLWSGWWLAVPAAGFLGLALVHDRVLAALDRARRAVGVYERGLARIEDRWSGTGATGATYAPPDHPYAADLDLFGDGSLFQLLSAARLHAGEETLANWLLSPADLSAIAARQAALDDLRGRVDLREQLELTGESVSAWLDTTGLANWGAQPPVLSGRWPRVIAVGLALVNLATLVAGFAFGASPTWAALAVICSVAFSMIWRRRVHLVIASVNAPARHLRLLAEVLALVESEQVSAPHLAALHARLAATGDTASHRIAQLTRLVDLLESRQNQVFAPVALLLLWGTQLAWAIETWRRRSGPSLAEWVAVAGEFEALSSLAGYAFEHPADPFADIVAGGPVVEGVALAHPLLPAARVVPNDVALGRDARVLVVSGSNMSGKSTLLRTVGVNVVLALAGAPVRAQRMAVSPLALGATLRIQDSLQAGKSRFFAEITRLKQIVDLANGPIAVLFLLDELLAGTNSHDRRLGAAGIVQGLVDKGAIGLVTTHDLALAEVVSDLGVHARNVHFSDTFENGQMRFDYRMREGVVRTSNALALMRSIGLAVDDDGRQSQRH
jgi:MutS domain V